MANRIITKALAGLQDLLLGRQTAVQARASGDVSISGVYADNIPHDLAGGLSIHGKLGKKVEVVTNIAALQALDTDAIAFNELYVYVQGYFTATDGGGGLFWLDTSDTSSVEDLKYIFNPDNLANGRWKRVDPDDQLTNDNGDANIILTTASYKNQLFNTNFTANRTVTLPTTGLYKGKTFRIIRTNTAAYTLTLTNITPSVVLAASESTTVEVIWDGTAWRHVSKSIQIVNTAPLLAPYNPAKLYYAHEAAIPNMTVLVDAGKLIYNDTLVTNLQQIATISAADITNARIDRISVSKITGLYTVTTGTPAASPIAPAVPVGDIPICQVSIPANATAITNSQITDERIIYVNNFNKEINAEIKFTTPALVGSGLAIAGAGFPALTALGPATVAMYDSTNAVLGAYYHNGSSFALVGSGINLAGARAAIAALSTTDVAIILNGDLLACYRFNGSTWSVVGGTLAITASSQLAMCSLTSTTIALFDTVTLTLRAYSFNGSTWSLVGSALSIPGATFYPAITALNSTDIAFIDYTRDTLYTYRFNGTTWSQVGNTLAVGTITQPALTALTDKLVVFIDFTNDTLRLYKFDGTNWTLVATYFNIASNTYPALAALNGTDIAFLDEANDSLRLYRFSYYIGNGPHRPY